MTETTDSTRPEPNKRPTKGSTANGSGDGPLKAAPPDDLYDEEDISEFLDVSVGGALGLVQLPPAIEVVKKPAPGTFFRAWADPAGWFNVAVHIPSPLDLLSGGNSATYLLSQQAAVVLSPDVKREVTLVPIITAQGTLLMWAVPRDTTNAWNASMRRALSEASRNWIKIQSDRSLNQYVVTIAPGLACEPRWPELGNNVLRAAFPGDRMVRDREHHLVKRLLGEAL